VDNRSTGQRQVIHQTDLTTTSFTPLNTLPAGSYRAWVRAFNDVGQVSAWSAYRSFTVKGVAPAAPTLTGPAGGSSAVAPTFTWTNPVGAVRYDLWVDNVTTGVRQVVRQTGLSTTSFTPDSALPGGVYRVWVRAFDSSGKASPWSASRDFTISAVELAAPMITGPFGNTSAQPVITWNAVAGAVRYDLWVNNLTTGQAQVIRQTNVTGTSYQPASPLPTGNYRAWVQAWNAAGLFSAWSAPADFSVVPADLGKKVVDFAAARLGQQVGGGECTHLVEAALQAAGARTTFDYGVTGLDADYVWGDLVTAYRAGDNTAVLASVRPGDIIQYRNVEIREGFSLWSFPHHTAIVKESLGNGKFTILEQNVNGERWVHESTTNLAAMTGGVVWIYRPVQK
jgi:predicted phage tail protein